MHAEHIRSELDKAVSGLPDMHIAGPAPAPLLTAEGYYRYHLMVRTDRMRQLGRVLGALDRRLSLPDDVLLTIDIVPVSIL